jgi:endonuclease/exonuclease/phosphatase family metal-dependent hydrolase
MPSTRPTGPIARWCGTWESFLYRHQLRPYHIDYCFLPTHWVGRIRDVTVGDHRKWAAKSDHMPLTVGARPVAPARPL